MEKLWYKAVMIFAFSMTVVVAGYFLTGLNDQLAQQVQSGAVDNMSVVVLDAGHGGMDGGATAAWGCVSVRSICQLPKRRAIF